MAHGRVGARAVRWVGESSPVPHVGQLPGLRRPRTSSSAGTSRRGGGQAARRSYRWCRPPTSGSSITRLASGGVTARGSGASFTRDRWVALGARGGVARRRVPEPPNTPAEVGAVDRVPVMDQKARMLAISDGLDEALSGPDRAGFLGDARVDDPTTVEGENDEDVEEAEPAGYDDKEVAGPGLAEVISDEGAPALAALSVQASGAILGDRAGRYPATVRGETM